MKKNLRDFKNPDGFLALKNDFFVETANSRLTDGEYRALTIIMSFMYGNKYTCHVGLDTLCRLMSRSKPMVIQNINRLQTKGWITKIRRGKKLTNIYELNEDKRYLKHSKSDFQHSETHYKDSDCKDSETHDVKDSETHLRGSDVKDSETKSDKTTNKTRLNNNRNVVRKKSSTKGKKDPKEDIRIVKQFLSQNTDVTQQQLKQLRLEVKQDEKDWPKNLNILIKRNQGIEQLKWYVEYASNNANRNVNRYFDKAIREDWIKSTNAGKAAQKRKNKIDDYKRSSSKWNDMDSKSAATLKKFEKQYGGKK